MTFAISSRRIAVCAMIAAIYTALVLALPWLSYGPVQVRVAEALTILPVLTPWAIVGLGVGVFVSNLVGAIIGANPIGMMDTVFGTSATVIAAAVTYWLRDVRYRGLPVLSALSPVVVNAIIIGAQLSIVYTGTLASVSFLTFALWVGVGQVIACMFLGLPLLKAVQRTNVMARV